MRIPAKLGVWLLVVLSFATASFGSAPPGSSIQNIAYVSYVDSQNVPVTDVASNAVFTTVTASCSAQLTASQTITLRPGENVDTAPLQHHLTNNGNQQCTYYVDVAGQPGGNFSLQGLAIYLDANNNGQVDKSDTQLSPTTPITLSAGQSASLLVAGVIPTTALINQFTTVLVSATDNVDPSLTNTDTVTVGAGPAPNVTLHKSADTTTAKPGQTVQFSLNLSNTGSGPASLAAITVDGTQWNDIYVLDEIPANTHFAGIVSNGGGTVFYHLLTASAGQYTATPVAGQVDTVGFAVPALTAAQSYTFSFKVTVDANDGGNFNNIGTVTFANQLGTATTTPSNTVTVTVPQVPPTIAYYTDTTFTQTAAVTTIGGLVHIQAVAASCNTNPLVALTHLVTVTTNQTHDLETFQAVETGPNTGVFEVLNVSLADAHTTPVQQNDGVLEVYKNEILTATITGCGSTASAATTILVDPYGVLFDSKTDQLIAGAQVTLIDVTGQGNGGHPGQPATVLEADYKTPAPSTLTTGSDGSYQYPLVAPSTYELVIVPPNGFKFPSVVPPASLPKDRVITQPGSYGGHFVVPPAGVINFDVPLDPGPQSGFFVNKTADEQEVDQDSLVGYLLEIKNSTGADLPNVTVVDTLPPGFMYQLKSATLAGSKMPDPAGGKGPVLTFSLGTVPVNADLLLHYYVRLLPQASNNNTTNTAYAISGDHRTANATAKITILPGIFDTQGVIVGKVYADCNGNRLQDHDEPGVPGVRIYLDNGTFAITDEAGKYSIFGVTATLHGLKLDKYTLPPGLELEELSTRNAGDGGSLFVDMFSGELHQADFAVKGCSAETMKLIATRGKGAASTWEATSLLKQAPELLRNTLSMEERRSAPTSAILDDAGTAKAAGTVSSTAAPAASNGAAPAGDTQATPAAATTTTPADASQPTPAAQASQDLLTQLNEVLKTTQTSRGLVVKMNDGLFDTGKTELNPGATDGLAKVAAILKAHPELKLEIEGYTDSTGAATSNQLLSEHRAEAVREFLAANGLNDGEMVAHGFGESNPVASNDTPEGRKLNRRVDVVIETPAAPATPAAAPAPAASAMSGPATALPATAPAFAGAEALHPTTVEQPAQKLQPVHFDGQAEAAPTETGVGAVAAITQRDQITPATPADVLGAKHSEAEDFYSQMPAPKSSDGMRVYKLINGTMNNEFDFVGLRDGQVVRSTQINIALKGMLGTEFELYVNGWKVMPDKIGQRSTEPSKQLQAWLYIGMELRAGKNELKAKMFDPFGNERGSKTITVIAPGKLANVITEFSTKSPVADGKTPLVVSVQLVDAAGIPVTARTPLTLESTLGKWAAEDLNPKEPGTQVFIEGGSAEYNLIPPTEPGSGKIAVSSGVITTEKQVSFVPELRPMMAIGVVEQTLSLRSFSAGSQNATFYTLQSEMGRLDVSNSSGSMDYQSHIGTLLKGRTWGDTLLTLSYDSDKRSGDPMFRDSQSDDYYLVYGDSSTRGYDAQSTSRLYLRLDRGKDYIMYGDYNTGQSSNGPGGGSGSSGSGVDTQKVLSTITRSFTGLRLHHETDNLNVTAYTTRDNVLQIVQEIPANGSSGPYLLNHIDLVLNSETVEILVRDRNQPSLIISDTTESVMTDYQFDSSTGSIIFKQPISSYDSSMNPVSIRVTYEFSSGGPKYWMSGMDATARYQKLSMGGTLYDDKTPAAGIRLYGVNGSYVFAKDVTLVGEFARTWTPLLGNGNGEHFEFKQKDSRWDSRVYYGRTDASFDNPNAMLNQGRGESGANVTYKMQAHTKLKFEMIRSEAVDTGAAQTGIFTTIQREIGDLFTAEAGYRHAGALSDTTAATAATSTTPTTTTTGTSSTSTTATTPTAANDDLYAKLSAKIPDFKKVGVYSEFEDDITDVSKKMLALGGTYQFSEKGKVYCRHEVISSLGNLYQLNGQQQQNATVFGIDTNYMKDEHVFSEYRGTDAFSGMETEAAIGLRNVFTLRPGLKFSTTAEDVHTLSGTVNNSSLALTGALEYLASERWKGSARFEWRQSSSEDGILSSVGFAMKLSESYTVLNRSVYSLMIPETAGETDRLQVRVQNGIAFRPKTSNNFTALMMLELKQEKDGISTVVVPNRRVAIFTLGSTQQPTSKWLFSERWATKWSNDVVDVVDSVFDGHMVTVRASYDFRHGWSAGIGSSQLFSDSFSNTQYAEGLEVGHILRKNLWLAVGYNLTGFYDRDLSGEDATRRGVYLRLRYKFDESLFPFLKPEKN